MHCTRDCSWHVPYPAFPILIFFLHQIVPYAWYKVPDAHVPRSLNHDFLLQSQCGNTHLRIFLRRARINGIRRFYPDSYRQTSKSGMYRESVFGSTIQHILLHHVWHEEALAKFPHIHLVMSTSILRAITAPIGDACGNNRTTLIGIEPIPPR